MLFPTKYFFNVLIQVSVLSALTNHFKFPKYHSVRNVCNYIQLITLLFHMPEHEKQWRSNVYMKDNYSRLPNFLFQ